MRWGPQRFLGAVVWSALILVRWLHSQFFEAPAQWWVDTVTSTCEESAKAAVRETFGFITRFVNGMAALTVSLFVDRSFWRRRSLRRKRSRAWENFWAESANHGTLNAVIEQEGLIATRGRSLSPSSARRVQSSYFGSSWFPTWNETWPSRLWRRRNRTATTVASGMTRSGSDLFDRPSGYALTDRTRSGLLETTRINLEMAIEALCQWVHGVACSVLFLRDRTKRGLGPPTIDEAWGHPRREAAAGQAQAEGGGMHRNRSFGSWEDTAVWTASDVILQAGYPLEEHVVTTSDGFILTMQRIPRKDARDVVFFQHGVLDTSLGWVSNGVAGSQAFAAFENGADVWLGSCRANPPRAHVDPARSGVRYWAYSINEMGMEDIAAQIDRIHQVKTAELSSGLGRAAMASAGVVGGDGSRGTTAGMPAGSTDHSRRGLHKRSGSDSALAAAQQLRVAADAMPASHPPNEANIREHNLAAQRAGSLDFAAESSSFSSQHQRRSGVFGSLLSMGKRRRASADPLESDAQRPSVPDLERKTNSFLRLLGLGADAAQGEQAIPERLPSSSTAVSDPNAADSSAPRPFPRSFPITEDIFGAEALQERPAATADPAPAAPSSTTEEFDPGPSRLDDGDASRADRQRWRLHRLASLPVVGRRFSESHTSLPHEMSSSSLPSLHAAAAAAAAPPSMSSAPRHRPTSSQLGTVVHGSTTRSGLDSLHDSAASTPRDLGARLSTMDAASRLMTPDRASMGGLEHAPLPWARAAWDPLPVTSTSWHEPRAAPSAASRLAVESSSRDVLPVSFVRSHRNDGEMYRLQAVGHSLGGASLLIYAVMCRVLGRHHHLAKLVLLTPAGFHHRAPKFAIPFIPILPSLMWLLNKYRPGVGTPVYIPSSLLRYVTFKLTVDMHQIPALNELTRAALRLLLNGDASEWDRALQMPHYNVASMPALSLHTGDHLLQLIAARQFLLYNYGSADANIRHYGTASPPDVAAHYHLLQGLPIDLVAGRADGIVAIDDVMAHYDAMRRAGLEVTYKELNVGHLDVTFAVNDEVQLYLLSRLGLAGPGRVA